MSEKLRARLGEPLRVRNPRTNLDRADAPGERPTPERRVLRGGMERGSRDEHSHYRVLLRDMSEFGNVRTEDLDRGGRIKRVSGERNGGWNTVELRILKEDAHVEGGILVGDTDATRDVLEDLLKPPIQIGRDKFSAEAYEDAALDNLRAYRARRHPTDDSSQRQRMRSRRK